MESHNPNIGIYALWIGDFDSSDSGDGVGDSN